MQLKGFGNPRKLKDLIAMLICDDVQESLATHQFLHPCQGAVIRSAAPVVSLRSTTGYTLAAPPVRVSLQACHPS